MPFKDAKRVKFKKNPLRAVVCQIRFPVILEIAEKAPIDFQEKIKGTFPILNEGIEIAQKVNIIPQSNMVIPIDKINSNKNYEFHTLDKNWTINLAKSFLSIECKKYSTWEDFLEKFKIAFNAFNKIYNPAIFTRIGLRYIDVISKKELKVKNGTKWKDLISAPLIGMLNDEVISKSITGMTNITELTCPDKKSKMRIRYGLVFDEKKEKCFLLDSDTFFPESTNHAGVLRKLKYLHERPRRFMKYAITDKLYKLMEPEDV